MQPVPTNQVVSTGAAFVQNLPDGWQEATSDNGKKYYYNTSTGETSWQFPTTLQRMTPPNQEPAIATVVQSLPLGWQEATTENDVNWTNILGDSSHTSTAS